MTTNDGASVEMPRYRCHKEVWALKIVDVAHDIDAAKATGRETDGSAVLTFEAPYGPLKVHHAYVRKHQPAAGGYYVVYHDGYTSFSPAKVFEDGYTPI